MSKIGSVVSGIGNILPVAKTIGKGITVASSIVGGASGYFSSTDTVYTRAKSSGSMQLTGTMLTNLGGAVTSINNIPLRTMNNASLGLWNLREVPEFSYDRYQMVIPVTIEEPMTYKGAPTLTPKVRIEDLIVVNPQAGITPDKVRVIETHLFTETKPGLIFKSDKVADNCYWTNFGFEVVGYARGDAPDITRPVMYVYAIPSILRSVFINVTVEFDYGSHGKFVSSRNFEAIMTMKDNNSDIQAMKNRGVNVIHVN